MFVNMRIVAIIEARMTSSRLPGKVLLPAAGKPMLEHLVNRLKALPMLDEIVVATSKNDTDDPLEEFAQLANISCFRGSEQDVMERVLGAARSANADVVVGITGDCPCIDPALVKQVIDALLQQQCDYVSNGIIRSYPDGMDAQAYKISALEKAATLTNDPLDREHVTLFIYNHPELFTLHSVTAPPEETWPELGLTLDEEADYQLLKTLIEHFVAEGTPLFSCKEAIDYLRAHPELVAVNQHVARKGAS